jgi:Flp pilus assembly protein TadG
LVLPYAVLVLLALVQVGVVVHDQVMVTHAAREAARAAAVRPELAAARRGAEAAGGLDPGRLHVAMTRIEGRGTVEVRVDYVCVTDLPLVGPLVPDVSLRADATMQVER